MTVSVAALVATVPDQQLQTTATQTSVVQTSSTSTAVASSQPCPLHSFRPCMTTSSVEIPQQSKPLQAWLSLGSYEDVLNSDFRYWEVRKQLSNRGMEMTRLWRLHTPLLRERFNAEVESVKRSRPPGGTTIYWIYTHDFNVIYRTGGGGCFVSGLDHVLSKYCFLFYLCFICIYFIFLLCSYYLTLAL